MNPELDPGTSRRARAFSIARRLGRGYLQGLGAVTGASLVLGGLKRGRLSGILLAAGGVALVLRSVTGHWLPRGGTTEKENGAGEPIKARDFPTWDEVDEAGVESFPASDPPSYSPR